MLGWLMYSKIQQLKLDKYKKTQVARKLGVNIKTVMKYWDISPEKYSDIRNKSNRRSHKLDQYQSQIVARLHKHPDFSAAQIHDWLKEVYPHCRFRERTVRRYVASLRQVHNLYKETQYRQCEAVDELPPGQQIQVDFGEISVPSTGGRRQKMYCMAAVLAHSRFKYAEWSNQPFTSVRLTGMLRRCFEYIGGVPQELVFDQDKLVAVSENHGDIIYTEEFERFKQAMRFQVYLCRKSDPESKGKVEAVVKYLKNNFAKHRLFTALHDWNKAQLDWLERTGNQNEHGTIKKVPAKVHVLEKPHLRPIPSMELPENIVTVTVRKDNTILYKGNRYSVPLGTYHPDRKLRIDTNEGQLTLADSQTGNLIAEHRISLSRGLLIKNNHHRRDNTMVIDKLQEKTLDALGNTAIAEQFLTRIRGEKSRYARDQFQLLMELADHYPVGFVQQAIAQCVTLKLWSAVSCRDMTHFLSDVSASPNRKQQPDRESLLLPQSITPEVRTEHRPITAYTTLYGGISP